MRLTAIGTAEDVIGFALAGSPGVICETEAEVTAALNGAGDDREIALVVVSGTAAQLAPEAVRVRQAARGPLVIVLR